MPPVVANCEELRHDGIVQLGPELVNGVRFVSNNRTGELAAIDVQGIGFSNGFAFVQKESGAIWVNRLLSASAWRDINGNVIILQKHEGGQLAYEWAEWQSMHVSRWMYLPAISDLRLQSIGPAKMHIYRIPRAGFRYGYYSWQSLK